MATLTVADRAEIANKLCLKAIAHNAENLQVQADKINASFWAWYLQHLTEDLPLTRGQIDLNLQRGTLQGLSRYCPQTRAQTGGNPPSWVWSSEEDIRARGLMWAIKNDAAWRRLFNSICTLDLGDRTRYSPQKHDVLGVTLTLVFTSEHTMPAINGFSSRIPVLQPGLIADGILLCKEVKAVIESALQFHEEVSSLLAAVRTDKQLLDLMPEALPFIPVKEPKTRAVVPIEFANALREKLASGVPVDRKGGGRQ